MAAIADADVFSQLLKHIPVRYEVKEPVRILDVEATVGVPTSQMPTGFRGDGWGRSYYMVGRYPKDPDDDDYPVIDLILFHGDFLNANHDYIHENKHVTGFGSYGDVMIRDRKMYVAPTPFALTDGTAGQCTLILPNGSNADSRLKPCGDLIRTETDRMLVGYNADLRGNSLAPQCVDNPSAGLAHRFTAYRAPGPRGPRVTLKNLAIK